MRRRSLLRCAFAARNVLLPKWRRKDVGTFGAPDWRVFFSEESAAEEKSASSLVMRSPWHDLPLFPSTDPSIITFVCEIPKGTRAKIEMSKNEPYNPFAQDVHKEQKGKPLRFFTFGDIPFNYGFAPRTWEDPSLVDAHTKCLGDGDPIDVVEISKKPIDTGTIRAVRVLGVVGLIDEGETDWKIIVESLQPGGNDEYGSLKNVPRELKDVIVRWMRYYKTTDGKKENELMFNGEIGGVDIALDAIQSCSQQYTSLISGTTQNRGYWLRCG